MEKYNKEKNCLYCKVNFITRPRFIDYCSQKCKNPLNRGEYKPWNKGKKLTVEQKTKINTDGLIKGRGWNKGKPNLSQKQKWIGKNNPNWEGKLNNLRLKKVENDEFKIYKRECKKATYRSKYAMKKNGLIPENTGKRKDQLQLDHIIPFKQGFDLKIKPEIIGHSCNLQWILGKDNRKKWDRYQPINVINKVLGEYNGLFR